MTSIVEGHGDVAAFPALIGRVGQALGTPVVSPNPIKAKEWPGLKSAGEFERYLELAYRRGNEHIIVALDLDDGCAVTESNAANERAELWRNGRDVQVSIVFFVREYETMFLHCVSDILGGKQAASSGVPESIRDAKGEIKRLTGRRYKELQEQLAYTRAISLGTLFGKSRSFKKLCKEISGLNYDELSLVFTK